MANDNAKSGTIILLLLLAGGVIFMKKRTGKIVDLQIDEGEFCTTAKGDICSRKIGCSSCEIAKVGSKGVTECICDDEPPPPPPPPPIDEDLPIDVDPGGYYETVCTEVWVPRDGGGVKYDFSRGGMIKPMERKRIGGSKKLVY